jgi:hypothetical protein
VGIEIYLLKPGLTAPGAVEASSAWTDPSTITHIHLIFESKTETVNSTTTFKQGVNHFMYGRATRTIIRTMVYNKAYAGNLNDTNGDRLIKALDYILSEWPKLPADNGYSVIYRKVVGGAASECNYVWSYDDDDFIALKGMMTTYAFGENSANNIVISSISLTEVRS